MANCTAADAKASLAVAWLAAKAATAGSPVELACAGEGGRGGGCLRSSRIGGTRIRGLMETVAMMTTISLRPAGLRGPVYVLHVQVGKVTTLLGFEVQQQFN